MTQKIVNPIPENLLSAVRKASKAGAKGPPPVHLWNPPYCGEIDMRIARDGTWFHEGTPIGRPAMVRLFAGILKREGARHYLVTPVEKVGIIVEDVPFIAVDFDVTGQGTDAQEITFVTNVDDLVTAGPDAPLRIDIDPRTNTPLPYVMVRRGLEARIDRKSFLRLAELGGTDMRAGVEWFGLRSGGVFFPLVPSQDLAV